MKFRVDQQAFAEAVAWGVRSVPSRPTLPVLAGLRLDTQDDLVVVSSVDYETSTRIEIAAEVLEPGTLVVNGRLLADIVRSLPGDTAEVVSEGTRATLTSRRSRFVMLTLPTEAYLVAPVLPPTSGTIGGSELAQAMTQVSVAASREDSLPALTGIRMEISDAGLTLVATDRYRLALREVEWSAEHPIAEDTAVLIPARNAAEAAKAFTQTTEVSLCLPTDNGEAVMGFEGGGRRITTRLLGGQFPSSFRSLFPDQTTSTVVVATADLLEATRRVALVAQRTSPLRLAVAQDQVILEAGGGEEAQAAESLPALVTGEHMEMAFNHTYLVDGLSVLDHPYVQISLTEPGKPAVLVGCAAAQTQSAGDEVAVSGELNPADVGETDDSFRYLLMPIRLS